MCLSVCLTLMTSSLRPNDNLSETLCFVWKRRTYAFVYSLQHGLFPHTRAHTHAFASVISKLESCGSRPLAKILIEFCLLTNWIDEDFPSNNSAFFLLQIHLVRPAIMIAINLLNATQSSVHYSNASVSRVTLATGGNVKVTIFLVLRGKQRYSSQKYYKCINMRL